MKQRFDNYSIISDNNVIFLRYTRSNKDWIDIIINCIPLAVTISLNWLIINVIINSDTEWYYYIVLLVVISAFLFTFIDLVSHLIKPTGNIVGIDKENDVITIKRILGEIEKFRISQVRQIEFSLHQDFVRTTAIGTHGKYRCRTEVQLLLKDYRKVEILVIQPTEIIDPGYNIVKEKLIKRSKLLVKKLAEETGVLCKWNGIIKEK